MEKLPVEICLKIFHILDYQNLATIQQGSDDVLWANVFKERWGEDQARFYAPTNSKSWKDVYEVQDRCNRVGLGLKITREGPDYYLIHGGEIQRHLGSRKDRNTNDEAALSQHSNVNEDGSPGYGILEKILFFIGDLEVATVEAKRSRII
ncbi:hypothetical protein KSS87_016441 [Heliosperma pusillum]|nr:hypothetical protein KSS87_016441 [Heliosperma pusillum]